MKERNKLFYSQPVKNQNRKWYQFWKSQYIYKECPIRVNKEGEIIIGKLLKDKKRKQVEQISTTYKNKIQT